ncbi:MAG: helix-turn-helix domain-containing protein [Burkholderiaceae bacterium]|jgi:transcriptional regulator with XRE-family HTH domain|nr:helix-turn-helix domain-containing protein [Burkholderiaceae bacterium]
MTTYQNTHPQTKTFGTRLREIRKRKGLSQQELGILAGLSSSIAATRINRYENNVHRPSLIVAWHIAKALSLPLSFFLANEDRLARLIAVFSKLPENWQEEVLQAAETRYRKVNGKANKKSKTAKSPPSAN